MKSLLGLLLSSAALAHPSTAPAPGHITASSATAVGTIAASSATATGTISGAADAGAMTLAEKKKLMSEYNRAQSNEEKALRHLSRSQMRELVASQSQRNKSWHESEKKARREFFASHTNGPSRRDYVQDYIKRKKEFDQALRTEYDTARKSWIDKVEQLKTRQKDQRKKFKAQVEQGQRPSGDLWPN